MRNRYFELRSFECIHPPRLGRRLLCIVVAWPQFRIVVAVAVGSHLAGTAVAG